MKRISRERSERRGEAGGRAGNLTVAATLAVLIGACSSDEHEQSATFACPSAETFSASVSGFVERRCGTLDCHGDAYRPMRLYGQLGLRHPSETNVPGGAATTDVERSANYAAVCGVEPEGMARVVADFGQSADQLLLVQKIRGQEGHKGGRIVDLGDPADACIAGWLRGDPADVVAQACQGAIDRLE